jgi:hypothetical protein
MKLAELQALFQAGVLLGDEDGAQVLPAIKPSHRETRETLFGVYVNAYRIRLDEFLTEDYPALRALLGEDSFDALVAAYISANPPRHRNARWYSTALPEFLRESEPWRNEARATSLACFERALTDAYDAAEAEALPIESLAAFPPERWPNLSFTLHPSLILLQLDSGTVETYEALTAEEERDAPPPRTGEEFAAVWRSGLESVYRVIEPDEYLALNEARAGCAFGEICQMAAFQQGDALTPERLAQILANWFEERLVVGVRDEADHSSNTPSSA